MKRYLLWPIAALAVGVPETAHAIDVNYFSISKPTDPDCCR